MTPLLKRSHQDRPGSPEFLGKSTPKHLRHGPRPLRSKHAANRKNPPPRADASSGRTSPGGRSTWYRLAVPRAAFRALGPAGQPSFPGLLPSKSGPAPPQPEPHPLPSGSAPASLGRRALPGPGRARRERACALAAGRLPGRDLAKLRSAGPRLTGGRAGGGRASVVGRQARCAGLAPVLCGILEVSSVSSSARGPSPARSRRHGRTPPRRPLASLAAAAAAPFPPARDKKSRRQERG